MAAINLSSLKENMNISSLNQGQGLLEKATTSTSKQEGKNFYSQLVDSIKEVNSLQKNADQMAQSVAVGKTENIHETMLSITQAELSFNLMVQVRNKVLEAYQEVMRMPV